MRLQKRTYIFAVLNDKVVLYHDKVDIQKWLTVCLNNLDKYGTGQAYEAIMLMMSVYIKWMDTSERVCSFAKRDNFWKQGIASLISILKGKTLFALHVL